jgi:hypothetical protein
MKKLLVSREMGHVTNCCVGLIAAYPVRSAGKSQPKAA